MRGWVKKEAGTTPEWHAFYDHDDRLVAQLVYNEREKRGWVLKPDAVAWDSWDCVSLPPSVGTIDEAKAWLVVERRLR